MKENFDSILDFNKLEKISSNYYVSKNIKEILTPKFYEEDYIQRRRRKVVRLERYVLRKWKWEFHGNGAIMGCADGAQISQILINKDVKSILGIEFSEYYCNVVRKKFQDNSNVLAIRSYAEITPIKSDSMDFILADNLLEHLVSPVKFAVEVNRILKKGCMGLIGVPSCANNFLPYVHGWDREEHVTFWDRITLLRFWRRYGFACSVITNVPLFGKIKFLQKIGEKIFAPFGSYLYAVIKKEHSLNKNDIVFSLLKSCKKVFY